MKSHEIKYQAKHTTHFDRKSLIIILVAIELSIVIPYLLKSIL